MQVAPRTVVSIEYTLTDEDGGVIDTSNGGDPLSYVHGVGAIIPGLEAALHGRASGDRVAVTVEPSDGYGEHDPQLVQDVHRSQFPPDADLEVGMQFQASGPGGSRVVTVVGVEGDRITLDGNHPLAGATLCFDVTVVAVRAATEQEIAHGHVHEPGGHEH